MSHHPEVGIIVSYMSDKNILCQNDGHVVIVMGQLSQAPNLYHQSS